MIENVDREVLKVKRQLAQKKKSITVEGDVIVPDVKPDVLNIINSNGNCYIYKSELQDNRVKVEGNTNLYLIYLSANGGNRSLNTVLDFSEYFDFDNVDTNHEVSISQEIVIKSIETKVLNERKINVKVTVEVILYIYCSEEVSFINSFKQIDGINILEENAQVKALKESGKVIASAKENISIDVVDEIAEIFKVDVSIINNETKMSYNKVLAKSDVRAKIVYLTEDDRIVTIQKDIPLMGFIDIPSVSDEDICVTKYYLRNLIVTPNAKDEHSIYFDIDYEINTDVYVKKDITIVKDLYSTKNELTFNYQTIRINKVEDIKNKRFQLRDNFSISDLNDISAETYNTIIVSKKSYDNKVIVEGEVQIELLYESSTGSGLTSRILKIPFNQTIECDIENPDISINVVDDNYIVNTDGNIECILECECVIKNSNEIDLKLINDINIEECKNEEYCSMVIYFVKPKDTLWTIAKQFKSTIDDIKYINNIDDNCKLRAGEKLYITRSV